VDGARCEGPRTVAGVWSAAVGAGSNCGWHVGARELSHNNLQSTDFSKLATQPNAHICNNVSFLMHMTPTKHIFFKHASSGNM
jgi:hypothetical protein